eukprot:gene32612-biopygen19391
MSLPPEPPPNPPPLHHEHETLIQYNLRNKVCAYCKRPGARLKCEGCRQRSYCDRKCQKKDWKQEHRGQCVKLQQVFVPPPPGWRGSAGAEASGGGGGAAAAAGGGGAPTVWYCGACNADGLADRSPNCPTCRAPLIVSEKEDFKRSWKLVHDRSPGRHTPVAQNNLGHMYRKGEGVKQDHVEAAKWFRKSAEAGNAAAQCNLGVMYGIGKGVEQDFSKAVRWIQLAGAQGFKEALTALDALQQKNVISTPPPGTTITTILLTSANAAKYNAPTDGAEIKPGRAAVLLDIKAALISFKLKNLQIHP